MKQVAGKRESRHVNFKQMFEDSPVAFYTCEADGIITYYNKAAAELWGRKPIVGKELWCGSWKMYYPDGTPMPVEESPVAKTLKTGIAQKNISIRIEKSGGGFRTLLVFPQPQFNERHELTGSCNTLVDITEQQQDYVKQATLSAIVESSDDAIISKNLNGIITSWNHGAERIFGYSECEALGQHITLLIPKNRLGEEKDIISNIRNGKRVDHIDTIRIDKSGREIPISVSVSPIKDAHGKIVGASKVARDITDRLNVEEKQAMLSAIVESSDDAIVSKNLEGIIMSWNRGAEQIFGYSEEEAIGRSITMLIPEERLMEEDVILGRIRSGSKIDHFETIRRHKSGKEIPVSITVSPIKDRRGNIIGASKVARDISAQVESQIAMESYIKNLETLNTIGKSISEHLDVKGILQRVTDATTTLTGAAYGAFYYNNVDDNGDSFELFTLAGLPPETIANMKKLGQTEVIRRTLVDKQVIRLSDITKTSSPDENNIYDGTPKESSGMRSYLAVPVVSKSGAVIGGLVYEHPDQGMFTEEHELMVVNIAAQAAVSLDNSRLFEQVKSLSDKKDEFIALASHELKTPLTTIKGYLQVLAKTEKEKMSALFLKKSLYQVDKLNTLVEDLLNMSRIEAGRLDFSLEVFDLKEMLQEIIETFRYSTKTHKIVETLGGTTAYIEGDKQRIEQAILNFLTNAIKYSPKADAIYVNLEVVGNNVTVRVRDKGIGLTEEQKNQLFTRFYRAENTQGISGLGLGLYLTKQIIDRHNGVIEVSSEYGKGSEFYFTLPMSAEKHKEIKGNLEVSG
ncbi:PAS domain S-box protein [Salinimicrobium sp. GXAS 041]|uniref:sensor histidine kinase n=1 Tax=Salinimicrobium sp. GXAS 041 TaxID=3400806 RepID=UPI003C725445